MFTIGMSTNLVQTSPTLTSKTRSRMMHELSTVSLDSSRKKIRHVMHCFLHVVRSQGFLDNYASVGGAIGGIQ